MSLSLPEIQQIPARHGTATFVPKGHVIKIINTYGHQVVDTWAFALPKPPTQEEIDEENEEEEQARKVQQEEDQRNAGEGNVARKDGEKEEQGRQEQGQGPQKDEQTGENGVGDKSEASATQTDGEKAKDAAEGQEKTAPAKPSGWSAYIPTIRGCSKSSAGNAPPKEEPKKEKKVEKPAEKRTWASYMPSGKGFSNYIPSASSSLSGLASTHQRDPTKSYAEQLYDFSRTPVGAGALSAAMGSGYAGSAYAAFQAYNAARDKASRAPPMEYLSMAHTRVATLHLAPRVGDTLVSNLRGALLTVLEDASGGAHDTLMAACDPQRYRELGVARWQAHGSCAENLVLALQELNGKAGLRGSKAVGADVTVNTVPAPLNLFMNVPLARDDGDGNAISIEAPRGKKGEYIRLRAERDVVVVMSACPMDVTPVNGGKCMAAHFIVQEPEKKTPAKRPGVKKSASSAKKVPQAGSSPAKVGGPVKRPSETKVPTQDSAAGRRPSQPRAASATNGVSKGGVPQQPPPKPGRTKPKKLERRTSGQTSTSARM